MDADRASDSESTSSGNDFGEFLPTVRLLREWFHDGSFR